MAKQILPPLIEIHGMNRYDLPAIHINMDCILNWLKYKKKIGLSDKESEKLYKLIKTTLNINAKEVESKNSINLQFSKSIEDEPFNNVLRQFIINFKICSKCKTPELNDNICKACGFNFNIISKPDVKHIDKDLEPKQQILSKATKKLLKEKKQPKRKQKKVVEDLILQELSQELSQEDINIEESD